MGVLLNFYANENLYPIKLWVYVNYLNLIMDIIIRDSQNRSKNGYISSKTLF